MADQKQQGVAGQSAAGGARTGRLDSRVQREDVGLLRDAVDLHGGRRDAGERVGNHAELVADLSNPIDEIAELGERHLDRLA